MSASIPPDLGRSSTKNSFDFDIGSDIVFFDATGSRLLHRKLEYDGMDAGETVKQKLGSGGHFDDSPAPSSSCAKDDGPKD
jgi:hypothetical protein